MESFVY